MVPPEQIYHYTGRAGLVGIVESGTLWATHTRHLNDTTENRHAREAFGRGAERLNAEMEAWYAVGVVCEAALAMANSPTTPDMFIVSFSHDGDNLSLWRAYASEGRGFAIGFDRQELEKVVANQGCSLVPITYDESEQEAHVDRVLSELVEVVETWGGNPASAPAPEIQLLEIGLGLTFAGTLLKNPHFRDEREWRVFHLIVPGVWDAHPKARVMDAKTISYEEIETNGAIAVTEVVVGPLAGPQAEAEVRHLLDRNEMQSVSVRRSTVPLSA